MGLMGQRVTVPDITVGVNPMCIMEVRSGQRSSTIAQALAHNTSTVDRDIDMLVPLLRARGELDAVAEIEEAQRDLQSAYARLLAAFAAEITRDVAEHHESDAVVGNEHVHVHPDDAAMIDAMATAAHRAERYETR